jgi:hypothetical protein
LGEQAGAEKSLAEVLVGFPIVRWIIKCNGLWINQNFHGFFSKQSQTICFPRHLPMPFPCRVFPKFCNKQSNSTVIQLFIYNTTYILSDEYIHLALINKTFLFQSYHPIHRRDSISWPIAHLLGGRRIRYHKTMPPGLIQNSFFSIKIFLNCRITLERYYVIIERCKYGA